MSLCSLMVISRRVLGQVNADVVDLVRLSSGKFVQFSGSTKSVGQYISTKAVGSDDRHDITHQYKYPEGTAVSHVHRHTRDSKHRITMYFLNKYQTV